MITAKHVLDAVRPKGKVGGPISVCHMTGKNKFYLRNIKRSFEYPNSDVVVVALDRPKHKVTHDPLRNKVVTLSFDGCRKGDRVCTFAYPKSLVNSDGKRHVMNFVPRVFEGSLIEEFPRGKDNKMLPNPCWQTNMHIHAGASGGPVFNSQGYFIGVNSTSFSNDTSCSFVSTVRHIINLKIRNVSISGRDKRDFTLKELADRGLLVLKTRK